MSWHGRRSRLLILAAVLALLMTPAVLAGGYTADPIVQVSQASPFAGCTADGVGTQSGFNYLHSEVEPWIDVNPANPLNMVGIWQQDRWSNGGSRGLVASTSADGGQSWSTVVIPGLTICAGGQYQRATDPWVTFGPDGVLYQLGLVLNDVNFDHALLASTSTDGGVTWSQPTEVIRDNAATVFNDKQSITADPNDAGVAYAVWDRLVYPSERASPTAAERAFAYRGPTWFSRTTDGGASWEPARLIYDPGALNQTIANQIVVLPDGTVVNGFNLIRGSKNAKGTRGNNVAVMRSTNQGRTWSAATVAAKLLTRGVFDPDNGLPVRTGDIIPDFAVDPTSGALYAVWQDARFGGNQFDSIAFAQSNDGGRTWSTPVKINLTPTTIAAGNQQAFTPSVHVAADGTVGVTYYDLRNNTTAPGSLPTDYFLVHCHPTTPTTCATAANWGNEIRLTETSFDMLAAPYADGFFVGDYEGLSAAGTDFVTFFVQSDGGDPASVVARRVGP